MAYEESRNSSDSSWAAVGKIAAFVVGIGAVGTGVYFTGKAIYDEGFREGSYTARNEVSNEYKAKMNDMVAKGLVLPEEGCLRYAPLKDNSQNPKQGVVCNYTTGTPLELRLNSASLFESLTVPKPGRENSQVVTNDPYGDLVVKKYKTVVEQQ